MEEGRREELRQKLRAKMRGSRSRQDPTATLQNALMEIEDPEVFNTVQSMLKNPSLIKRTLTKTNEREKKGNEEEEEEEAPPPPCTFVTGTPKKK